MDTFNCTCDGENPKCFKCYGTGMVPRATPTAETGAHPGQKWRPKPKAPQTASDTTSQPSRPGSATIAKPEFGPKNDQILCPVCKIAFYFREFPQHRRREHPFYNEAGYVATGQEMSQSSSGWIPPPTLHECPDCKARVLNLQKHANKVHSLEGQARRQEVQHWRHQRNFGRELWLQQQRSEEQTLGKKKHAHPDAKVCGFCRAMLPNLNALLVHFQTAHGLEPKTPPPNRAKSDPRAKRADTRPVDDAKSHHRPGPGTKSGPSDPYAQYDRERSMDATYGMGGTARDHGRFGSSASYDGMDDESSH